MSDSSLDRPKLLILGASTRAAASSAWRAGFAPMSVDLFADRDLKARFPAHRANRDNYPACLAEIESDLPDAPWIYTGALENVPRLIDRIAGRRPLLGIAGTSLRSVRDPSIWTAVLRSAGFAVLESRVAGDRSPASGRWILKPLASASGRGIRPWTPGEGPIPEGSQIQTYVEGLSLGATFLGDGHTAEFVGVTRQLLGRSPEGLRVTYRGSVGPWPIRDEIKERMTQVGAILARAFELRGLFGIDVILAGQMPWPVEINPRYSASVEVLEAALGLTLLADHARTFGVRLQPTQPHPNRLPIVAAKQILFATRAGQAPVEWAWTDPETLTPTVADLPGPDASFEAGDPVLTVLARGSTLATTLARLKSRARKWRQRIDAWSNR